MTLLKLASVRPAKLSDEASHTRGDLGVWTPKNYALEVTGLLRASRWREQHTGQEAVELHQELEVDIVALGVLAMSALDVVAVKIDT